MPLVTNRADDIVVFSPVAEPVKMLARFFSWIFHPLYIPLFVSWLIIFKHPVYRLFLDADIQIRIFAMVGINTVLFPAAVIFLLWRLGFAPNIFLQTRRDRIIPLIISIIFYFWAFWVARNLDYLPRILEMWLLGVFLASCFAMMLNIFMKISLHAIGMGGLLAFMVISLFTQMYWPFNWVMASLFISGLTASSRLALGKHRPVEIYTGFLGGILAQLASWAITA